MCIESASFTMTPAPYCEGARSKKKHGWASYSFYRLVTSQVTTL